ncbi:MAG TPA: two-component regulator propeller domain-containing protein, partial [Rhodanobacteraceae bacterium]|nr:two-component regulator propeller domain-containing protein [Rhodanobacteraceae bacterium]
GLARLRAGSFEFDHFARIPDNPQSLAANRIWRVSSLRGGQLLVGTWTNGFSLHDPRTEMFTQILSVPGDPRTLPARPALTVFGDTDGSLWVGVNESGGLVQMDPLRGVLHHFRHDPADAASLSSNYVQYVTRTGDGNLWVATFGGGLDRMLPDGKGFAHLRHDPSDPASLASDSVRFVYQDSRGTLWVATRDAGLDERCAGCRGFRHHRGRGSDEGDIDDIDISHVLETRDGAIWVATRGQGLYRRATPDSRFQAIPAGERSGLASNSATSLFQDSRGDLWVGTQGGALNLLRGADPGQRFIHVDSRSGLDSDAIGDILEAADGSIWVSTIKGISRIEPKDLSIRNFGGADGASMLGYWVNSGTRLRDGRLVFGGLDGVTLVDPARLSPPPQPQPVLTAFLLRGQRVGPLLAGVDASRHHHDQLDLAYNENDIGMEFSSLEYSMPETTRYAYKLEGHDKDWIETPASRRIASYTGLPPGTYRLHVRARHESAPWSAAVASMELRIHPAPWATPLALASYAALLLLLAGGFGWRVLANMRQRRDAQHAIQHSEERLKLALWGSGSEMWDIDMRDGSMHRENRLSNIAASAEADAQTLQGYRPFLHPDDLAAFEAALTAHLKGQSNSFEASYRTLDVDHHWVWLLTRGRVVQRDESGRALRISGTSSDISALKQADESLRRLNETLESKVEQRTSELRETNGELRTALERLTQAQDKLLEAEKLASLGSLVAGVAHEINTPLGIGVTAASYLQEEARRLTSALESGALNASELRLIGDNARESADLILNNLQRADRLLKSFKQVAVDQTGGDTRTINLRDCIGDVVASLKPALRHGHHTVVVTGPDNLLLRTSPGAISQILTNLVMNSLIHGFADMADGEIHIEMERDKDRVRLTYRDNGRGMSAEVRAHAFEPFFTTRRGRGGSGLGMHIVYSQVTQALHGDVELTSSPGAGVLFQIRFGALA